MCKKLICLSTFVLVFALGLNASAGLVAHYSFEEGSGTAVGDSSTNSHDGTLKGGEWVTGKTGNYALKFDAAGEYISLGTWDPGDNLTLACWVYWDGYGPDYQMLLVKKDSWDEFDMRSQWHMDLGSKIAFTQEGSGGLFSGDSTVPTGKWIHLTVTYDGKIANLYKNGSYTGGVARKLGADTAATMSIGTSSNYFNGTFDDFYIFDSVLSASEIVDLMQGGKKALKKESGTAVSDSTTKKRKAIVDKGKADRRESIEWCNIWIPDANKENLPRVLLIGDSITKAYYGRVEKRLKQKAYCAQLTTSASVCDPAFFAQLESVISLKYRFDVIHFNNGLHGFAYSEDEYKKGYQMFVDFLHKRAPGAKLICANSTLANLRYKAAELNPRINRRNAIITEIVRKYNIPINDLNKLMQNHPEYYRDDYHFLDNAIELQAEQVAKMILKNLHVKEP